jgi:hypothetical protein
MVASFAEAGTGASEASGSGQPAVRQRGDVTTDVRDQCSCQPGLNLVHGGQVKPAASVSLGGQLP